MLPLNKSKKPRGRPKKAKVVQSSFALGGQPTDKLFSSHGSMEEIEVITPIVISKNENPDKSYKKMRTGLKENIYAVVKYLIVGELAIDFAKVVSSHLILKIKFFLIKEYYNDF